MKKEKILKHHTVTFEHNGKQYQGSYTVDGRIVRVLYGMEAIQSLLPHAVEPPLGLATLLLSELVMAKITGVSIPTS